MRINLILFILLSNLYACAVCYGDTNSPMSHGMNMGILTLLGVISFILFFVVFFIISIYLKTKKLNKG